jgi:hypothetical protein
MSQSSTTSPPSITTLDDFLNIRFINSRPFNALTLPISVLKHITMILRNNVKSSVSNKGLTFIFPAIGGKASSLSVSLIGISTFTPY